MFTDRELDIILLEIRQKNNKQLEKWMVDNNWKSGW